MSAATTAVVEKMDPRERLKNAALAIGLEEPEFGTGEGKAYEIWLLLEVIHELARWKGLISMSLRDNCDEATNVLKVHGSPGHIPNDLATKDPGLSHFSISLAGRVIELHLGIQARGNSGTLHEADILVVDEAPRLQIARNGGGPFEAVPLMVMELKHYKPTSKLDQQIGRSLIGVGGDLDAWTFLKQPFINGSRDKRGPGRSGPTTFLALVTSAQLHDQTVNLLRHYDVVTFGAIEPDADPHTVSKTTRSALGTLVCSILRALIGYGPR